MSAGEPKRKWFQIQLSTCVVLMVVMALLTPAIAISFRSTEPQSVQAPVYLSTTFLLGCAGMLGLFLWRIESTLTVLGVWAVLSMILGYFGIFVPFGGAIVAPTGGIPSGFNGFCGQGLPLPSVMWDDGKDFPNPLAFILNPLFLFFVGAGMITIARTLRWAIRAGSRE